MLAASSITPTKLGAAAESRAADYLPARGLRVMAHNLRCKCGELDLLCLDGEVLVIVEVRKRGCSDYVVAPASVTAAKQRKLIRATRYFWQRQPEWRPRTMRFEVIAGHYFTLQLRTPGHAGRGGAGGGVWAAACPWDRSASPSGKVMPWLVSRA